METQALKYEAAFLSGSIFADPAKAFSMRVQYVFWAIVAAVLTIRLSMRNSDGRLSSELTGAARGPIG